MKTTSLKLSKQLKEAGYPQDTYALWEIGTDGNPYLEISYPANDADKPRLFASPTADEILDQIGEGYVLGKTMTKGYYCSISLIAEVKPNFYADSLADAAAKMWLYLKKEKLI